jgi:hypothetical protein
MTAKHLIKQCADDIVSCVLGDNQLKVIKTVPVPNSTFSRTEDVL